MKKSQTTGICFGDELGENYDDLDCDSGFGSDPVVVDIVPPPDVEGDLDDPTRGYRTLDRDTAYPLYPEQEEVVYGNQQVAMVLADLANVYQTRRSRAADPGGCRPHVGRPSNHSDDLRRPED